MTMQWVTLKPARPGLVVRGPDGAPLPVAGQAVTLTTFWARRLRDGDVMVADAGPAKSRRSGEEVTP